MPEIKARLVLAFLAFSLFFVGQMNRVNINIAIVAMEDSYFGNNWDSKVIILGAYYWCYSLIELPGTFFLRKYGCRKILTIAIFLCGLSNFIFPIMYRWHPVGGILIRALQGLAVGITWPAITVMSAKWIPREERSKFTSTYQGASIGTSVTYALGGVIIYSLGWPYLFYSTGILCIIWAIFWWYFAFDSPEEHPRISDAERIFLEETIGKNSRGPQPVPWKQIFSSKPFWAVFVGTFGIMWFAITIAMQLPAYLHDVHHVNIRTNGLLLCIPDVFTYLFSLSFSIFIDKQIKQETMTITNARKLAFIFSHLVPAVILIFLGMHGLKNILVTMILIILAAAAGGATSSGNLANIVDISPSNGGIIMGICKSLCFIPGILSPIIVKYFTADDPKNWLPVFLISSVILILTSIFYFLFGSGEIQPWDKQKIIEEEMKEKIKLLMEEEKKFKTNDEISAVC